MHEMAHFTTDVWIFAHWVNAVVAFVSSAQTVDREYIMSDHKLTQDKRARIVELRQRGASWAAIGRDRRVDLDRRTAKKLYEEWETEQSCKETLDTRLQLKRELMAEHVAELVSFAGALARALNVPEVDDDRGGQEVVMDFLLSYAGMRDSHPLPALERDERRLLERRNERLHRDLLVHSASTDVSKLVKEYEVARDAWVDGKAELEERADVLLTDCLRSEGEIGSALSHRRGVVRRLAQGLSLAFTDAVLRSADPDPVRASFKHFGTRDSAVVRSTTRCHLRSDRIYVEFSVGNRTVTIEGADDRMHTVLSKALDNAAQTLVDGPGAVDVEAKLDHALVKTMQCHDDLMTAFDDASLRRLILDTRCDHCPL